MAYQPAFSWGAGPRIGWKVKGNTTHEPRPRGVVRFARLEFIVQGVGDYVYAGFFFFGLSLLVHGI